VRLLLTYNAVACRASHPPIQLCRTPNKIVTASPLMGHLWALNKHTGEIKYQTCAIATGDLILLPLRLRHAEIGHELLKVPIKGGP
jgi:hypothetical protein